MQEIQIQPDVYLSDLGCVFLQDDNSAVISDLHLGFEEEMNLRGVFLPRMQRNHVESVVDRILDRYNPDRIIINGDFKHEFARNLPQEWDDITHFIDKYRSKVSLVFVRGNHDNFLQTILGHKNLDMVESYETDRYFMYHGDKDRGLKKITILGHEHPSIALRDEVGGVVKMPAFVYNAESQVIITPALSFFSSGTDVTQSLMSQDHFTPVLSRTNPKKFRVFGLTEEFGIVDFGDLGDLQSDRSISRNP